MHIASTAHPTGTGFYRVVALMYVEGHSPRSPLPLPDTDTGLHLQVLRLERSAGMMSCH